MLPRRKVAAVSVDLELWISRRLSLSLLVFEPARSWRIRKRGGNHGPAQVDGKTLQMNSVFVFQSFSR